ncbi:MAG: hypothetical protein O7J95_01240, partial [Planctomycetota bacterium]|nr:hypothetical protein [Planctomycetota bacterium]
MMAFLRQPLSKRVVFTCAAEIVAFNAIFLTCHRLLLSATAGDSTSPLAATFITFFLLFNNAVIQFALWSFGVYTRDALHSLQRAFLPIIGAIMFGMINALPVYWLFAFIEELPLRIPFYQALLVFPSFALFLVVERYVLARLLEDVSRLGNVLVLGTGPDSERVVEQIRRRSSDRLRLAGVLSA